MTKYILLILGFVIAVLPTAIAGVWNGQSLLGAILCLLAGAWILATDFAEDVAD